MTRLRTDNRSSRKILLGLGALILLCPQPADAHLVTTGLGPVYDGVSHLLLSLEDLLPVLAMALLAGLNGARAGRRTLFCLTAAWLAGGFAGFLSGQNLLPETVVCGSFLVLGGLVAADLRLPDRLVTAMAIALGLLHGWLNGAGLVLAQRELLGLLGIGSTLFVLVAIVSAAVVSLRTGWPRIAVRVAGSWVAASGLLMLGWSLRGGA